jgi:hypothetical protein
MPRYIGESQKQKLEAEKIKKANENWLKDKKKSTRNRKNERFLHTWAIHNKHVNGDT